MRALCAEAWLWLAAFVVLLISGVDTVQAQKELAVEAFEPSPVPEGSVLSVQGARPLSPRAYQVAVFASYGRRPLTVESGSTGRRFGDLVGSIGSLTVSGAVGLLAGVDLAVAVPAHRISKGSDFHVAVARSVRDQLMQSSELALGDLRLVPRVNLLPPRRQGRVGLALLLPLHFPTGDQTAYAGEPFRFEMRLASDVRILGAGLVAAHAGYVVRTAKRILGHRVDDLLRLGAGADLPINFGLSALVELDAQLNVRSESFRRTDAPMEGRLGLRYRLRYPAKHGVSVRVGGGTGLVRGIAAPRYRLFVGVAYAGALPADTDGDGVNDRRDRCPAQREDFNGRDDEDGCPDADEDGDGVPDVVDRCPQLVADRYSEPDGCPDPDDDDDHIPDERDLCPLQAEDHDGFEDHDGCPE